MKIQIFRATSTRSLDLHKKSQWSKTGHIDGHKWRSVWLFQTSGHQPNLLNVGFAKNSRCRCIFWINFHVKFIIRTKFDCKLKLCWNTIIFTDYKYRWRSGSKFCFGFQVYRWKISCNSFIIDLLIYLCVNNPIF